MEVSILAVKFLGIALIALIVGIVLCFLASLGYNTYLKIQDKNKKIEVCAENTNSKNKRAWVRYFLTPFILFIIIIFITYLYINQ